MKIHNLEQGSPEWHEIRKGKMTASNATAIGNCGKGLETYTKEIVRKQISSKVEEEYSNKDLERGRELELVAREMYELEKEVKVEVVGFIENDEYSGCSPDGLVGEDGGVEIKCSDDKIYFDYLLEEEKAISPDYLWQCQMNLFIAGRKWWDLIIYNPNFEKSMFVFRILPDLEKFKAKNAGKSLDEYLDEKIRPLEQYNDPTAHFRMVREEIKKAAQDGKTKLQFPTGETAMKIEELGEITSFTVPMRGTVLEGAMRTADVRDLVVGNPIRGQNQDWVITDVLGDGKFKAMTKGQIESFMKSDNATFEQTIKNIQNSNHHWQETFDISGKVDTNNPIYKFYEKDVQNYLKKFDGKRITDDKGVEWIEVPIKKEQGKMPVEAFGLAPLIPQQDEK